MKNDVEKKSIKFWQSSQSSFMIETYSCTMIYDWYMPTIPPINKNKPLFIFISHMHMDHFNPGILKLAEDFNDVGIFIGNGKSQFCDADRLFDEFEDVITDCISVFDGEQFLIEKGVEIRTLCSTDEGVAFIVEADGLTFFHAGDLARWRGTESLFERYCEPIRNMHIDFAMLPMDPRFGDMGVETVLYYLKIAQIACFSPMHLWDNYDYIGYFAEKYPQYAKKMLAVNSTGLDGFLASIELNKPNLIRFAD